MSKGGPDPPNGAAGVPTSFSGLEIPDPIDLVPGRPEQIGWMPALVFDGPWVEPFNIDSIDLGEATLRGGSSGPTSLTTTWEGVLPAVALLPHRPLRQQTWYRAEVVGRITVTTYANLEEPVHTSYPFDVAWKFKTGIRGFLAVAGMSGCHPRHPPRGVSPTRMTYGKLCPRF